MIETKIIPPPGPRRVQVTLPEDYVIALARLLLATDAAVNEHMVVGLDLDYEDIDAHLFTAFRDAATDLGRRDEYYRGAFGLTLEEAP